MRAQAAELKAPTLIVWGKRDRAIPLSVGRATQKAILGSRLECWTRDRLRFAVEHIVRAAGVTKPMLYRHFESKQELCVALLERYRDELIAAPLLRLDAASGDWRTQIPAMLDAWLQYVEQNPDGVRLLFMPISGDPEVERVQHELHARQAATQTALLGEPAQTVPRGTTPASTVPA